MAPRPAAALAVPLLVIATGIGWLLTSLNFMGDVFWLWIILLAATGIGTLAVHGLNKVSIVVGPFLLACSIASLLRQIGTLSINIEVPALVIVLGVLMLVSQILPLGWPKGWSAKPGA